jgi:hypothetical protein
VTGDPRIGTGGAGRGTGGAAGILRKTRKSVRIPRQKPSAPPVFGAGGEPGEKILAAVN